MVNTQPIGRLTRLSTPALVTLLTAILSTVGAAPAGAHPAFSASTPGDETTIDTAPSVVKITFTEAITPASVILRVSGPDGLRYDSGDIALSGRTISRPLTIESAYNPPVGRYTVGFQAVSKTGHRFMGTYGFNFRPTNGMPTEATSLAPTRLAIAQLSSNDPGPTPNRLPWMLAPTGAAVLAVAVGAYLLVIRRRRNH